VFWTPIFQNLTINIMATISKKQILTCREIEVLELIAKGETSTEIAKKLYISPDTSKLRMKTLREKLHAATAAQAVYQAMKMEILV
jgi:DNA-binding NarL/FixJ family response regulator